MSRIQQQVDDQRNEIEGLKARLQEAYDDTAEIRNLYEEQGNPYGTMGFSIL